MIYNINDLNISNEISSLKSACSILQEACLSKDRDQINRAYNYATGLPIIGLRQRIQFETQSLFYSISPNISVYAVAIDNVDPQQLELNINGCFNALKVEIELRELYRNNNSYAQRQLSQRIHAFHPSDVINYTPNGVLKVADLLSVLKYASSIAEAIDPQNEDYARATATITVCQAVDAILNNKTYDNPINKLMHLMTSFLCTTVKSSISDPKLKQGITISSIAVDLAIDFFCKK